MKGEERLFPEAEKKSKRDLGQGAVTDRYIFSSITL